MKLQDLKDHLSREATGMTAKEAREQGLCSQCRNPPEFYSELGRKEFGISGLCEFCFDMACDPEVCKNCQTPKSWHEHNKTECKNYEGVERF